MAENEGGGPGGKPGARDALEALTKGSGQKISRRQAIAAVGVTAVVGVGAVTGRRVFLPTSNDKPAAAGGKSSSTLGTTTTEAPATTTQPPLPDLPLWSDPASWGGKVPGAGDVLSLIHI